MTSADGRAKGAGTDYEAAKAEARSPDPEVRRRLAARTDVRPELLYYLASDESPAVRREVAANPATPRQADLLLTRDGDDGVRTDLGRKIARLVPDLPPRRLGQLERLTLDVLDALVRDQAVVVRRIIAETLKDVVGAPPDVIKRLARDLEIEVAGPILQHSPVLTDDDLLAIIGEVHADGALAAIAQRAHVAVAVADAIADSNDPAAIALLLANGSAQIREETLDRLIERAPDHEPWHGPLVRRPRLPSSAARRLATFVADHLVEALYARDDLDPATAEEIATRLRERIEGSAETAPPSPALVEVETDDEPPEALPERPADRARRLRAEGLLDEEQIDEALLSGDRGFVLAALAELAELPETIVQQIVDAQSARGVTALAWKAKLSARFAYKLQLRLAHLSSKAALPPRDGVDYPMTVEDMRWQLELFGAKV